LALQPTSDAIRIYSSRFTSQVGVGTIPTAVPFSMKLTNDTYVILLGTKNFTERYYRAKAGWLKISARGRKFRMTAEQLLNHLLPALAGIKPNLTIKVEHQDSPVKK
jgi:hypothetical protein